MSVGIILNETGWFRIDRDCVTLKGTGLYHYKGIAAITILVLRINVTEKNFCHMGNQAHDLDTNCLAHRSRMLYQYTKSLSQTAKFINA